MDLFLYLGQDGDCPREVALALERPIGYIWTPSHLAARQTVELRQSEVKAVIIGFNSGQSTRAFVDWLHLNAEFAGPIIAATPDSMSNAWLIATGCTHQAESVGDIVAVLRPVMTAVEELD